MTVRRDTRRWLESDPGMFDQILARICGAWDAEDPPDKPPSPYEVCKTMGISYGALLAWITDEDDRAEKFDRALKLRAQLLVDETLNIADGEGVVARDKVRIQARQWVASKWDRKRYGEHVQHDVSATLTIEDAEKELERLDAKYRVVPSLPAPDVQDAEVVSEKSSDKPVSEPLEPLEEL